MTIRYLPHAILELANAFDRNETSITLSPGKLLDEDIWSIDEEAYEDIFERTPITAKDKLKALIILIEHSFIPDGAVKNLIQLAKEVTNKNEAVFISKINPRINAVIIEAIKHEDLKNPVIPPAKCHPRFFANDSVELSMEKVEVNAPFIGNAAYG